MCLQEQKIIMFLSCICFHPVHSFSGPDRFSPVSVLSARQSNIMKTRWEKLTYHRSAIAFAFSVNLDFFKVRLGHWILEPPRRLMAQTNLIGFFSLRNTWGKRQRSGALTVGVFPACWKMSRPSLYSHYSSSQRRKAKNKGHWLLPSVLKWD